MNSPFDRFVKDDSGATAIEYGLQVDLIAVVMIAGATSRGTAINQKFNAIVSAIGNGT